jgi:Ca-activated chloride channel family protein
MRFENSSILWLLLVVVPLLSVFLWRAWRKQQQLIARFVQSRLLAQLTAGVSPGRRKLRMVLLILSVALGLLTLAQPQWGFDWEETRYRGLDIVVGIDTSRSMLAEDVRPSRLARAKLAAFDLMRKAKSDRLALVAFAGDAFLQCPLTLDEEAFRQSVDALDVGIISQGGTALTAAIETALTAFKSEGENYKILVLLTDGEDHESGAVEAAKKAAAKGLRIFTMGVGTPNGELIRVTDDKGIVAYVKDAQGSAVKSRLNEGLLQEIATETGGFYLPLRASGAIETLYERGLSPLPKSDGESRLIRRYHERFQWPLSLVILLLMAEMLIPQQRRVPRVANETAQSGAALRRATAVILALLASAGVQGSPASAFRQYQSGNFTNAIREYEKLLEKTPDDSRLHYNSGAAAYRNKQYDLAARGFTGALTAPDLDLQHKAFYNLGDSLYRLGEQMDGPQKKIEQWENSVKQFKGALKLDPRDADAKHNLEFVEKKLEELKQQQQKQDQNKDKQDKKDDKQKDDKSQQDQQKDQQQSKPDDKSQDQKKQDQQKQDQRDSKDQNKEDKSDQGQSKDKGQNSEDEQQNPQPPQDKEGGSKGDSQKGQQSEGQDETSGQVAAGQMTAQQAEQLLDAQKGDEKAFIFLPPQKSSPKDRIFKDW